MRASIIRAALVFAALGLSAPAQATTTSTATLTADNFELDLKNGTRIYRGSVEYRHGDVRLRCDELVAIYSDSGSDSDGEQLATGICTGTPSRFTHASADNQLTGKANKITFTQESPAKQFVVLESAAEVQRGDSQITGARITYDLTSKRITVNKGDDPQTRPRVTIK